MNITQQIEHCACLFIILLFNDFGCKRTYKMKKDKSKKPKANHPKKIKTKRRDTECEEIDRLQSKYDQIDPKQVTSFTDIPLSRKTLRALKKNGFVTPTPIQRDSIAAALRGKDVLGAAKTGSGKTLAFLVPLVERLFCKRWTRLDGVGALVISPTRELSKQIYRCLSQLVEFHEFNIGLVIGGEGLKEERKVIDQCNIIVCTPGRLLQHMNENYRFACDFLQVLVLDEADRCLDMGFKFQINAIVENLPLTRQTLLFSATQTTSVKDLARLSLQDYTFVSVDKQFSTPDKLEQIYIKCELHEKMTILWNFLKHHSKQKIIVFLSNCKFVRYVYEMFTNLGLYLTMYALYGTLSQTRRNSVYDEFIRKPSAVLFATDLVARGLDFPEVHWVVQLDCPEDSATYIHRIGRTARYHRGGKSLLLLVPSEMALLQKLSERNVAIEEMEVSPDKMVNPVQKMKVVLCKDLELAETAKRAVTSYVKSLFWMKDKEMFNVNALNIESFAQSLGLATAPRIRFLEKKIKLQAEKIGDEQQIKSTALLELKGDTTKLYEPSNEEGEGDDYDTVDGDDVPTLDESTMLAEVKSELNLPLNKKIVFEDDNSDEESGEETIGEESSGVNLDDMRAFLKEQDELDKQIFRDKVKSSHRKKKIKAKEKLKKLKEEEEAEKRDEFGESSEDDEPDLSWLPDPDKVYAIKTNEIDKQKQKDWSDDDEKLDYKVVAKKNKGNGTKRKKGMEESDGRKMKKKSRLPDTSSLSVNEAEELALLLLRKK